MYKRLMTSNQSANHFRFWHHSAKEFLGVEMSLGDIKKLSTKDVEKYYLRYQTILGKQLSSSLVDSAVLAASKAVSMVVSIDNTEC